MEDPSTFDQRKGRKVTLYIDFEETGGPSDGDDTDPSPSDLVGFGVDRRHLYRGMRTRDRTSM